MSTDLSKLTERIRNEAAQAARPGQMERLEAIADDVERLRRGARTLGHTIEQQGRMVLDVTGMHHVIGDDGDGDWGAVWENLYEFRRLPVESDLARLIWETSRADEGTISAAGADHIARAIIAAVEPAAPTDTPA